MDIKKTVGTRINSALARCGMLQKDLAKVLGVTDNTISYYCKGVRGPQLEQLPKIAKALNTTTDYLLGITNDPDVQKNAVDELGLTPTVISKILNLKSCAMLEKVNRLFETDEIWGLLLLLSSYRAAFKADWIYARLVDQYRETPNAEEIIAIKLIALAEEYREKDIDMYDFLRAEVHSLSCDKNPLVHLGLDEFTVNELYKLRINKQLDELCHNLINQQIRENIEISENAQ